MELDRVRRLFVLALVGELLRPRLPERQRPIADLALPGVLARVALVGLWPRLQSGAD
jgi:hypothetical protein